MSTIKNYILYLFIAMLLIAGFAWKLNTLAAAAIAIGISVAVYMFMRPFVALGFLVLLLPLEIVLTEASGRVTLLKLTSFIIFSSIALRVLTRKISICRTPINIWIAMYLLAWVLSFIYGDPAAETWTLIKDSFWFVSIFIVGLYGVENENEAKRIVYLFLFEMTLIALFGYFQVIAGTGWVSDFATSRVGTLLFGSYAEVLKYWQGYWKIGISGVRVIGTFFSPDYYCAFLGYPLSFAFAIILKKTGKERFMAAIAWLLMFGNVILTYSRGGWLSMAASTAVMLLATGNASIAGLILVLCIPIMVLSSEFLQAIPYLGDRLFSIGKAAEGADPRYDIWAAMLVKIKDYPLFGHGAWGTVTTMRFSAGGVHGHNLYLELLYAIGIVGLLAFLAIITVTLWQLFRKGNLSGFAEVYNLGFIGALVWFLCQNIVDFQFYHAKNGSVFWLMLGIFFAISVKGQVRR